MRLKLFLPGILMWLVCLLPALLNAQNQVVSYDSTLTQLKIEKIRKNIISCTFKGYQSEIDRDSLLAYSFKNTLYLNKTVYEWKYGKYARPAVQPISLGLQSVSSLGASMFNTWWFVRNLPDETQEGIPLGIGVPAYLFANIASVSALVYFMDFTKENSSSLSYTFVGATTGAFIGMTAAAFSLVSGSKASQYSAIGLMIAAPVAGSLWAYYSSYSKKGTKLYRGWSPVFDQYGYGMAYNF